MKGTWMLLAAALLAGCAQQAAKTSREDDTARSETTRRAQIHTDLAAHYFTRGQFQVALTEVNDAIAIEPRHAPAYNVLALIQARLREEPQAEESFRKSIALAPNYSEVRNNYGLFLCQRKRYREALPHFDTALDNPLYNSPEKPLANAGLCAVHMGEAALAEGYLLRALARVPNQPTALLGMAEWHLAQGNAKAAQVPLRALLDMNEFRPQALWLAVRVERALGNREAEANYGLQLRRGHPESIEAKRLLDGQYDTLGAMP